MITQAIISAGGFGTRLRPYTDTVPKPMIPLLGKPMLAWHIEQFKKHGVTEIFITLHHIPEAVTSYFGDGSNFGVRIHYYTEETPLGSGGGVASFAEALDPLFYYIYGDTFSLMDYSAMAGAYALKKNPIGMQRTKKTDDYADADIAEVDEDGRFLAIHKKPHSTNYPEAHRMRGSFILNKRILSYIPKNTFSDLAKDVLPRAIGNGESFYGYESSDFSKGIDTIEKWREVEEYLKKNSS